MCTIFLCVLYCRVSDTRKGKNKSSVGFECRSKNELVANLAYRDASKKIYF